MSDKFAKWEKIRQKGKMNLIIKDGVLLYGVFTTVFCFVLSICYDVPLWPFLLPVGLILFISFGVFHANHMWKKMEKTYMKSKAIPTEGK